LGGLAALSLVLVTLGIWDRADLALTAALFVAVLLLIEGLVRVTVFFRGSKSGPARSAESTARGSTPRGGEHVRQS